MSLISMGAAAAAVISLAVAITRGAWWTPEGHRPVAFVITMSLIHHVGRRLSPYDRRTARAISFVVLVVMAGCAGRSEPRFAGVTMPSPDGCFIHVWEAPRFAGTADFINGPRDYPTLRDLPGGRLWNNRIRSASPGLTATVTLWTDENFQGIRLTLTPETGYRELPESVAGRIESMRIDCLSVSAD